jgi:hypothetical protein
VRKGGSGGRGTSTNRIEAGQVVRRESRLLPKNVEDDLNARLGVLEGLDAGSGVMTKNNDGSNARREERKSQSLKGRKGEGKNGAPGEGEIDTGLLDEVPGGFLSKSLGSGCAGRRE